MTRPLYWPLDYWIPPGTHCPLFEMSAKVGLAHVHVLCPRSYAPIMPHLAEPWRRCYRTSMTQLAEQLDKKLATWKPEIAAQVEQLVSDVIVMADANALDILSSRTVVQKALDNLDES